MRGRIKLEVGGVKGVGTVWSISTGSECGNNVGSP